MSIDRTNKKGKWTAMKYVKDFNLIVEYADAIRDLKAKVDDQTIIELNEIMKDLGVYFPRNGVPSIDTTSFKICQLVYFMFAYRSDTQKKELVFSPLGNLLLDNLNSEEAKSKTFATMLYGLPYNHPYNKMSPDFNIYPYRLIYKLLLDERMGGQLFQDELFYYVEWTKTMDEGAYDELVDAILRFREIPAMDKYMLFTERLSLEDSLANALHEAEYMFGQLESAGIVDITEGQKVGVLCHGGFGRGEVPDYLTTEELARINRTGRRMFTTKSMRLKPYMIHLISELLGSYPFDEKPHDWLDELGRQDYILHLYNFYPKELLLELGIEGQRRIETILQLSKDIRKYSRNEGEGDCYRFENVLADAFNEFDDVEANAIGGAGNTDVECIYLTINEKFDVEAKSTQTKLGSINAGRLKLHRQRIGSNYTIIVAPYYKPSVESDIANTECVMITASSLSNFLYQYIIHCRSDYSYAPLYKIVQSSMGTNITSKVNAYVSEHFGIGRN